MDSDRSTVGPYRIVGRLGAGGMGEVFLAEDSRLRRRVALKAVTASFAARPEARQRLLREARAAAALNHPNIAAIYDVLETDAGMHIVMELVEGSSLDEMVRRGPLPIPRVLQIGLELADALAAAHAQGVVHRDLKPSNVRLTPTGHVKVLDFGLARTLDSAVHPRADEGADAATRATLTEVNQFVGTPAYMAPEQLRGGRGDPRTDVYGLGVLIFELLTGHRPFDGTTPIELAVQTLTQGVPDVRTLRPETPADLAAIVARATARDPGERLGSAAELRDMLQAVYAEQPTPSPATPVPAPAVAVSPPSAPLASAARAATGELPTAWYRRPWVLVAAAVAVGLVALTTWRLRPDSSGGAARPSSSTVAVLPVSAPPGASELESAAAGVGEILAANLGTVPGVQVLSRGDTAAALGTARDVKQVLRELAPTYVVNAAVAGTPSRFRLEVTLLDADGRASWSRTYEGRADDPFGLPAQVSADVGRAMVDMGAVSRQALAAAAGRFQRPPTSERTAWAQYTDALRFLDRPDIQGNLTRATTLLEEAVAKDPNFALGWAALGTAYSVQYEETRDEQWVPRVQQANLEALRLDPDRAETRLALAQMYENTGAHERAIDELQRAMAIAPTGDHARRVLGGIYTDIGRYDDAVAVLRQATDLRPGFWRNWSYLGYAYFQAGRHQDAIAAYERLLALQPDSARGHAAYGVVLHEIGRVEEARAHYRRALDLDPTPSAWSNLGTLDFFEGRYADAVGAYEKAIAMRPKDATYHNNLGDARTALRRRTEAASAYATALELLEQQLATNPRDAQALSQRSLVEARLGRMADARRHAADALAMLPDNKEVLYHSCAVATLDGRLDEAAQLLERALEHGYSVTFASRDPNLASLRQLPGVRERLAAAGSPK